MGGWLAKPVSDAIALSRRPIGCSGARRSSLHRCLQTRQHQLHWSHRAQLWSHRAQLRGRCPARRQAARGVRVQHALEYDFVVCLSVHHHLRKPLPFSSKKTFAIHATQPPCLPACLRGLPRAPFGMTKPCWGGLALDGMHTSTHVLMPHQCGLHPCMARKQELVGQGGGCRRGGACVPRGGDGSCC